MIYILTSLIITASAFSPTAMTVEGVVTKFDEKTIQLKQKNGAIITVPRDSKKTMQGVKLNKDVMRLQVESSDFLRLNAQYFEGKPDNGSAKAAEPTKEEHAKESSKPKSKSTSKKKSKKKK